MYLSKLLAFILFRVAFVVCQEDMNLNVKNCVSGEIADCYSHCHCQNGMCNNITVECIFGRGDQPIKATEDITGAHGKVGVKLLLTESLAGSKHWSIQIFVKDLDSSVPPSHPPNISLSSVCEYSINFNSCNRTEIKCSPMVCVGNNNFPAWCQKTLLFVSGVVVASLAFLFYIHRKVLKTRCKGLSCFQKERIIYYTSDASRTNEMVIPTPGSSTVEEYPERIAVFGRIISEYQQILESNPEHSCNCCRSHYVNDTPLHTNSGIRDARNMPGLYSYVQCKDVIPKRCAYQNIDHLFSDQTQTERKCILARRDFRSHIYVNHQNGSIPSQYLTIHENPISQNPEARQILDTGCVSANNLNKKVKDNQDYPYPLLRGKKLSVRTNLKSVHV